jgi:hypothetical protein
MNVSRLMDLILFEPEGNTAGWPVISIAGKGPALQGDDRVAQPPSFFLGNCGYISANSISESHIKFSR